MVNKHEPHVFVLPEDDANSRVANAFHKDVDWNRYRQMKVLAEAGGWSQVLMCFKRDQVAGMEKWPHRFMVLLIDFDGKHERLSNAKAEIPAHLTERVFILGALTEPEDLRKAKLGSYEAIGKAMADDCREDANTTWGHDLLRHNAGELDRLREHVRRILF
ncbi:MAG TPA: hypothetical protein VJH03_20280 [Blastocatellia bacterium]|nr:hypothetical protein [Blastocatellia bacterium]